MTGFERTCLWQILIAGFLGTLVLLWGPINARVLSIPWCCGWAGAVGFMSQTRDRNGFPKEITEPEHVGNTVVLPIAASGVAIIFACFSGLPIMLLAWAIGAF